MVITEQYIEDVLSAIVANIHYNTADVFFDYGNYIEIANKLSEKNRNNTKYPLFVLIEDVTETETDEDGVYKIYNFNMIIAYNTLAKYSTQERLTNIFKLVLQPLYRQLLDQMKSSGKFKIEKDYIEHTKTNRYFLGSQTPNQNQLNDFVDAIEINFRNVKLFTLSTC